MLPIVSKETLGELQQLLEEDSINLFNRAAKHLSDENPVLAAYFDDVGVISGLYLQQATNLMYAALMMQAAKDKVRLPAVTEEIRRSVFASYGRIIGLSDVTCAAAYICGSRDPNDTLGAEYSENRELFLFLKTKIESRRQQELRQKELILPGENPALIHAAVKTALMFYKMLNRAAK